MVDQASLSAKLIFNQLGLAALNLRQLSHRFQSVCCIILCSATRFSASTSWSIIWTVLCSTTRVDHILAKYALRTMLQKYLPKHLCTT
jgi:hypothetical protein